MKKRFSIGRTLLITIITICEILGYILLFLFIRYALNLLFPLTVTRVTLNLEFVFACIYRALYFIGFSTGYVYIIKSFEERKKIEELERQGLVTQLEKQALENDLVESQNNYLRSQINPHFLFNTLNFIYNDARKKAPMAADAIMNLSEMMRYALKRPEAAEMVPLSEEVEQIEHLINLHRLRTGNTINMKLTVNGDLFGVRFPPLILLTLVENMFKHGNISHSAQEALVKITYTGSNLNVYTINMVNEVASKSTDSHHVGIENVSKRLHTFYGDDATFDYFKDPSNRYITEIKVQINNPLLNLNR
ncbi:sensor histidine kinase [Pedobacter sp. AW1-32]|uniref:sensor histidine kinase n=1 Tax=Pedobacter sp. AW1-32 TaxID=3383026 RepID=UPI003FF0D1B4